MKITEATPDAIVLPKCPKCGAEDAMEPRNVKWPDAPLDANWDECAVCGHQTDPE